MSDKEIEDALAAGYLQVEPALGREQFSACSIDLRIGDSVCIPPEPARDYEIRPTTIKARPQEVFPKIVLGSNFYLEPGEFLLGETLESIAIAAEAPIMGFIEGKSGVARHGLLIHCTAPVVHPGWSGPITLELVNLGKYAIPLVAGAAICQMLFARLGTSTTRPYSGQQRQQPGFINGKRPLASRRTVSKIS